jgi:glutathionylspermidine synthase
MQRHTLEPRADWIPTVERLGMIYHHTYDQPYWNESAAWEFTAVEIDTLEKATAELWARCLDAVEHVITRDRFTEFGIPMGARPLIAASWEDDAPSLYARLDLEWDGTGSPKLLEVNADTPTMLLEAAVIQWAGCRTWSRRRTSSTHCTSDSSRSGET